MYYLNSDNLYLPKNDGPRYQYLCNTVLDNQKIRPMNKGKTFLKSRMKTNKSSTNWLKALRKGYEDTLSTRWI